jgi:hypothetical protein
MGMQTGSAHPGDRNFAVILRLNELQDGFVVEVEEPTGCADEEMAMLWVLNQSEGKHSLLGVAERSALQFKTVKEAADLLVTHNLLLEGTQKQAVDSRT